MQIYNNTVILSVINFLLLSYASEDVRDSLVEPIRNNVLHMCVI